MDNNSPTPTRRPSVYDYLDYRRFLSDFFDYLRDRKKFSVRSFASQAGFASIGYVTMILKGDRNLTPQTADRVAKALRLTKGEHEFFVKLVHFNSRERLEDKDSAYRDLLSSKNYRRIKKLDASHYEFFSHWYHVALLEVLDTALRSQTTEAIATAMGVSTQEVVSGLKVLLDLGLIQKTVEGWQRCEGLHHTEPQVKSLSVRKFHREMITKALDSIDGTPPHQRELGSLTISLSQERFEEMRKRIYEFNQEMNELFSGDPSPDRVYQLSFQLFPLAVLSPNQKDPDPESSVETTTAEKKRSY